VNVLAPFVALDRARSLASGVPLPDRAHGAALFADVSGFTALTDALVAERGRKRGAEELLGHINSAYEQLVSAVHDHAGSIVGFAGDAVTCWFDDAPALPPDPTRMGTIPPGTLRAASAATRMHTGLQNVPPVRTAAGTEIRLAVKIAIATGPVRRLAVGDPGRQRLDSLAGDTLSRMAALERRTRIGHTLIDPPLAQSGESDPMPWPPLPRLDADLLAEWVLPQVVERVTTGGAFLGDLRPAVPMFIGFGGIDFDAMDSAGHALDAWVRWVQATVGRFGGEVIQLIIGDKGTSLLAVFGAPVAHEDDADRACAAALALHDRPSSLGFVSELRIGLAHGQVFAGACGSTTRRCYTVMGEPVNLAARLMTQAASGETLADGRMVRGAARHAFDDLHARRVKGREAPVEMAVLRGEAAVAAPVRMATRGALVGRDRERAALLEKIAAVDQGQPAAVLLEGEAGIGKSRLLASVVGSCRDLGRPVLVGAGNSVDRDRPYQAWRPVVAALLREPLAAPLPLEALRDHLEGLRPGLGARAGLLAPLLEMSIPDAAEFAALDAATRAEQVLELMLDLLSAAGPLVLVIEDAHWIDSPSWSLVRAVQRAMLPVALILTMRPIHDAAREGALPEACLAMANDAATLRLALGPLSPSDALALARDRVGAVTLPSAVGRIVEERAEGNPLFVEELVQAMLEVGILRVVDGHGVLEDATGAAMEAFPDTLEGLVTSRVDRLTVPARQVARVGSVIGRVFELSPLRGIFPAGDALEELPESLAELARLEIAAPDGAGTEAWAFRHAIIHEVVYGSLPFARRRALHRDLAEWYQAKGGDDLEPVLPLLAHHWERADAPDQAIVFGERAGAQALRNYANREAAAHLERVAARLEAGEGGDDPVRHVRVLRQLAEALYLAGDVPRAGERLRQLFARTGRPLPRSAPTGVLRLLGAMTRQVAHRRLPGLFLSDYPAGREERVEVARALALLTLTYYYTGDLVGAFLANFEGLNLAEQARADATLAPVLATAFANVGAVCTNIFGMPRAGTRYFERAEAVAAEAGAAGAHGYLDQVRGMVATSTGRTEQAERPLLRAAERFEGLGNARKLEEVGFSLAQLYQLQGRMSEAEASVRRVVASSRRRESTQALMLALAQLGSTLLWQGRSSEALEVLEEAAALHAREPYLAERTLVGGHLALLHARASRPGPALTHLAEVRELLLAGQPNPVAVEGYAAAAEAAIGLQAEDAGARSTARLALAPLRQLSTVGSRVHRARRWYLEGLLLASRGRHRAARRRWRKGLGEAMARGLAPDEGLLRLALSRSTRTPEERRIQVERLRILATTLPAPWLLHELDAPSPSTSGR
jgi:class 3 adenylate cyclase/tetratricopeptide (TPR) repeat protein